MTFDEFQKTDIPPAHLGAPLLALWQDGRGDWELAHQTVQDDSSTEGAWVHAYLHRKEGDKGNALYWYDRADQPFFEGTLKEEWREIVETLLPD